LKNLSSSEFIDSVVFKGGTSLSKVYKCIERFSEDIDLAIIGEGNLGDSRRKTLLKSIEQAVSVGLTPIQDHPLTEKKGRNRKTFFQYSNLIEKNNLGPVRDVIQLEINTFTEPVPYSKASIDSMIAQYLRGTDRTNLILKYDLVPFKLNVLSLERTFFEKILSLIRLSYNGPESLKSKIRHFYDIVKIYNKDSTILSGIESAEIFRIALNDDKKNSTFAGVWLANPLSEAPLFNNFQNLWRTLEPVYKNDLREIIWIDTMPEGYEIIEVISKIESYIKASEGSSL